MAVTDLTGTKWVFNDTLDFTLIPSNTSFYIDFTSKDWEGNDTDYMALIFRPNATQEGNLQYYAESGDYNTQISAYSNAYGWYGPFKTINITGGTKATDSTLIAWIEANAMQIIPKDVTISYSGSEIASMEESGTKTLLTSGKYCEDDILVEYVKPTPNLQAKTVNPSLSQQVITADQTYEGLSSVTVNAMTQGSATTPATTINVSPTISISSSGLITATTSKTQSVTPTVSAGYVSSGTAGTITISGSNTQQMTVQAAQTITPTTTAQTIASGKYLTGTQTIAGDANLVAANIKKDVTIFGVTGTHEGGTTYPAASGESF